jgi:hypothetical protein
MTNLLTPELVATQRSRAREEQGARVRNLGAEEERLVKSINDLRKEEQDELRKQEERQAAAQGPLAIRKTVLEQEVDALEDRKRVSLIPVHQRLDEANAIYEQNQKQSELLIKKAQDQDAREARLKETENTLVSRETAILGREKALDMRAITVETSEEQIRTEANALAREKAAFAVEKADYDRSTAEREAAIEASEKALQIRSDALDERENGFLERERGITVRYAFLEKAEETWKLNHPET